MSGDQADSLEEFTIRFRALPDGVPVAVRVRRMLKHALRSCRLQNIGWADLDDAAAPDDDAATLGALRERLQAATEGKA